MALKESPPLEAEAWEGVSETMPDEQKRGRSGGIDGKKQWTDGGGTVLPNANSKLKLKL